MEVKIMDKEAREKIRIHNHPKLEQSLALDKDHVIIDREVYEKMVAQFGIDWLGYRKLPKDKPPLLGDEAIFMVLGVHGYTTEGANGILNNTGRAIAQAQREADIKHYEGK